MLPRGRQRGRGLLAVASLLLLFGPPRPPAGAAAWVGAAGACRGRRRPAAPHVGLVRLAAPEAGGGAAPAAEPSPTAERLAEQPATAAEEGGDGLQWFVPGFVLFWAVGYSSIIGTELFSGGLGDSGGTLAVGFGVLCVFLIMGVILKEALF